MPYIVFCVPRREIFISVCIFCAYDNEAHAIEFCANANQMRLNGEELSFFYVECLLNPNQFQLNTLLPTMLKNRYESTFSNMSIQYQTFGEFKKVNFNTQFIVTKYNQHIIYQTGEYQPSRAKVSLKGPDFAPSYTVFSDFPDESLVVDIEYG